MGPGYLRRWIAVSLTAALLAACDGSSEPQPRLVIVYAPCTVNREFLAPYDSRISFTPNLAAFAAESLTFANHYTEAPSSGIAYASILSGSQADHHGVYRHPARLTDDVLVMAEVYRDAGYDTFLWYDHEMATPELGYDQGVDPSNTLHGVLSPDAPEFQAILQRLQSDPDYRAFVMATFTITHSPYHRRNLSRFGESFPDETPELTPAEIMSAAGLYWRFNRPLSWGFPSLVERLELSRSGISRLAQAAEWLYASNVNELDRLFGALVDSVDEAGLRDAALVAFTADHGELLYREGVDFLWSHSMSLEPDVLRVPLLVRLPGARRGGETYAGISRSIDLLPTLASLSSVDVPTGAGVAGENLAPAILAESPPPELIAYSHTTVLPRSVVKQMRRSPVDWSRVLALFPSEDPELIWASLRSGPLAFKLRRSDAGEWKVTAFDTRKDPLESEDVFDSTDAIHRERAAQVVAYKERLVDRYRSTKGGEAARLLPLEQEAEALRKLGYIE